VRTATIFTVFLSCQQGATGQAEAEEGAQAAWFECTHAIFGR